MLTALSVVLGVVVVLLITAVTGYFVAQEFAYMAVDRSRLAAHAEAGDAAAGRALAVTRRTSFMLSGAQLGITVTGLLVGYVAEPLIGRGLGEMAGGIGIPTAVGIGVGTVLAIVFSTLVQMLFGELFPKNLAIARPEPVARWLARSTTLYLRVFGWLIWLFDQSSNVLLRALRIEPVHDVEHSATPRDLEHIVAASRDAGELPRELSMLLDRMLDFPSATAEHAMIPRSQVDLVNVGEPVEAVLARMSTGHTRYPVVGRSSDDILGIIELHDLLVGEPTGTAGDHMRPAELVPESLALPEVVARLSTARQEMALVVDEYGGFAGIVTIEDIAEELVGEIADEHDSGTTPEIVAVEGGWLMPGDIHLDEVERVIGVDLPAGDFETIAGLIINAYGGLPEEGDRVEIAIPRRGADYIAERPGPARTVAAEVRAIGKHVPSSVWLTVRTEQAGDADE
ncbi:hemolysin family protein [Nocardia sp. IBHARD005]|uniref:hemolysin family protein n=1 Tax=Nocardia sp. IBHARD005 TaxID=3457765 RepID=UPI004059AD05